MARKQTFYQLATTLRCSRCRTLKYRLYVNIATWEALCAECDPVIARCERRITGMVRLLRHARLVDTALKKFSRSAR